MRPPSAAVSGLRRSGIRELMDLARTVPDVVHLEIGEPDFATPGHIVAAACQAARAGHTKYTNSRGVLPLREAIAHKLSEHNRIEASPDEVIVTCGAVNAILSSLTALTDPGDTILLPDPAWPNYQMMAGILGLDAVRYPLDAANGFLPDLDRLAALAAASPRAKVLIVNSPGNPTGAVLPPSVCEAMLAIAQQADLYLLSDECYEQLVFDGAHWSPGAADEDGRVISVFSVSKTYAMTGWRIGYLAATRPLTELVTKVQEATISCPPGINQYAALEAITGDQACVAEMRETYRRRRDLAVGALSGASLLVAHPHGAFYAMAHVPEREGGAEAFCRDLLTERGVAVAPGPTFGPAWGRMARISLSAEEDSLRAGLEQYIAFAREAP